MTRIYAIVFFLAILAAVLCVFIRIFRRVRRGGAGETAAALGSTYDMHGRDQRRAIETIVELKAGKKLEEQESSDTEE